MYGLATPTSLPDPPVIHQRPFLVNPSAECYRHRVKAPETHVTLFYRPGTAAPLHQEEWMILTVVRYDMGYTVEDWEPVFAVLFRGEPMPTPGEWRYASATVRARVTDVSALRWRGGQETWSEAEYEERLGFRRDALEMAWAERAGAGRC